MSPWFGVVVDDGLVAFFDDEYQGGEGYDDGEYPEKHGVYLTTCGLPRHFATLRSLQ